VADVIGMGVPVSFSNACRPVMRPAPQPGQDNDLVYGEWLGYGLDRVERLRARRVI
jgi:crotonobetainyl-CoA:carnitine CoA-transferase CaiB-like acyl-CoA transferase